MIWGLSHYIKTEEIHFTQIKRRILKVKPSVGNLNQDNVNVDGNKFLPLIVDASGLTKNGDYIERNLRVITFDFLFLTVPIWDG